MALAGPRNAVTDRSLRPEPPNRSPRNRGSPCPYVSHAWRDEHLRLGIKHSRIRPRRPQTNGKVERLNRTLLEEWAYRRLYTSEKARRAALSGWLHHYNHHRPHTALGNLPPITRCTNVPGQYT